ncbi:CKLF-like MARVEL transmembrane domain-containing protein 4 [Trichonephila clavipes]|nr:CKLF-like MARVEL transmembrane domain-containing protein 4 [Trichonephila clavipes]
MNSSDDTVNNIIGMICIMVSGCSWCSNSNWFNFVASTGLTVTGLLLLCYLVHIIERLKFVPWLAIELLYCATWTLFYMIAALVVAVKGGRDDAWAAAGESDFKWLLVSLVRAVWESWPHLDSSREPRDVPLYHWLIYILH